MNVVAFVLGIFLYKKFPREIKTVYYFVVLGAFTEAFMKVYIHYIAKNTMPIGHFYFPVAILILGIYYIQVLKGYIKPIWIITILSVYIIYCITNVIFIQGLFQYPSITGSLGALILFLFSVVFFTKVMAEAKIDKLSSNPYIWINSGILFYYSIGFFNHSLFNLRFKASIDLVYFAANTYSLVNQFFYIIIIIGFILAAREKRDMIHKINPRL